MLEFIISLIACALEVIFIKESFSIHVGPICSYSNTPWCLGSICCGIILCLRYYFNRINWVGASLGVALAVSFYIIITIAEKRLSKKAQLLYETERTIKEENVDEERLNALITLNKEKGLKPEERYCNCSCPFLSETFENCDVKKWYDRNNMRELEDEDPQIPVETDFGCDYALCSLFECDNLHCAVFGCTVDPISGCARDKQNGLCLLSQYEEHTKYLKNGKDTF